MSEPIPESVPTSQDPRSKRPVKRRALTPVSEQATQIQTLFKDPDKEIRIPNISTQRSGGSLAPPPEIVANVQGSSAGAGSGEFHVYKASRRREYERVKLMNEELKRENETESFERKRELAKKMDDEKTERNRRKREKRKAAKGKGKKGGGSGQRGGEGMDVDVVGVNGQRTMGNGVAATNESNISHENGGGEEVPGVIIHDDE